LLTIMLICETAGIRVARAADPAETSRIAALAGPDRAALLEKGARNEGELLIYTVGAQIDPLLARFRAKFPFLTVRTYKGDTVAITRRVFEEYKAGVYDVDAYELNDYGLLPIGEAGYLAPLGSPELAQYRPDAIEPHKRWVVMREDQISLGFNHAIISPSAAPTSNAELLDPKWKGKLGMYGESTAIAHAVGTILLSEGEDFLRKLAAQQPTVYNMGGRAVANLIVSGEAPIVINARKSHMFSSAREGAPVSWRAIGPVYAAASAAAIASRARHPYAAALFVDFMLSDEAQRIYRDDLGYTSLRKDMTAADEPRQKLYLGSRPDFETEYETWSRLAGRLFKGRR
jgi:iron(III) transport system substrate-binding protein